MSTASSRPVIVCTGISKQYEIGELRARYRTLRESLTSGTRTSLRRAKERITRAEREKVDNTIWALRDVTFDVNKGDVVGIVGRNGGGKSTLLKVLSRITDPTEGRAVVRGRVGSLLEVGTGFHPELTGRENVFLNGAVLGMRKSEIERVFDEIVDFAEVSAFIDTPVKHYSSGMYLRLAFAVAAFLNPEILLVDEVLAVGDAAFQAKCLGRMSEVAASGRTVLFVSHDMGAVNRITQRCVFLDHGRLIEYGPTDRVVAQYLDSVTGEAQLKQADQAWAVRLESIELLREDGVGGNSLPFAAPVAIRTRWHCQKDVGAVSFLMRIQASDGAIVGTSASVDQDLVLSPAEGDRFELLWSSDGLPLVPGTYRVSLVAKGRLWHNLASYERVMTVDVTNINAPQRYRKRRTNDGNVLLTGSWRQSDGSSAP